MCEIGFHICPTCHTEVKCDLPYCEASQYMAWRCEACDYWDEEQQKDFERDERRRWEQEQYERDLFEQETLQRRN